MHPARLARAALPPPTAHPCAAERYISTVAAPADVQTTPAPRDRPCRATAATDTAPPRWPIAEKLHWNEPGRAAAGTAAPDPDPRHGHRPTRGGPGVAPPRDLPPRFPRARRNERSG